VRAAEKEHAMEPAGESRPWVLLVIHTGHKYVEQHLEMLEELGCDFDNIKLRG